MSVTTKPTSIPGRIRTRRGIGGAAVASVGASLPQGIVENSVIEARLGLAPDWIERRTGIRQRHVAALGERLETHATAAAAEALAQAGVDAADVDLVLVATSTPDEVMPNAASLVAKSLGATRAGGYDIGAACSGFLAGLQAGASIIEAGRAECVVVVGADFMSRVVDPADRGTSAVFADGAGAVVLLATGQSRIGPILIRSEGDTEGIIRVERDEQLIHMAGHETFKLAVARLSETTAEATAAAGLELDDVDLFVYHQANARILTAVSDRLGLRSERVVDCISDLGNTTAATLPLALDHSVRSGRLRPGDRVLLAAFGAGFVWGATVLEWGVAA
ncbi:MAG TPA: beta-ketoacyl-ACP synthase 3 [Solirubrobacteraceae bacterium]|nr:beta-ketoacyl-ACP synthase 3 [Solirubrobacteraceae bacterium]